MCLDGNICFQWTDSYCTQIALCSQISVLLSRKDSMRVTPALARELSFLLYISVMPKECCSNLLCYCRVTRQRSVLSEKMWLFFFFQKIKSRGFSMPFCDTRHFSDHVSVHLPSHWRFMWCFWLHLLDGIPLAQKGWRCIMKIKGCLWNFSVSSTLELKPEQNI